MLSLSILYLGAQLSFDWHFSQFNIPITGQTLAVMAVSLLNSRRIGLLSIGVYLILGICGLPVFANGGSGLDVFTGKTGGYLMAFIVCPLIFSKDYSINWRRNFLTLFTANILGTSLILFIGFLWLAKFIGIGPAINFGIKPFLIGALVKSILGGLLVLLILKIKKIKGWQ